MSDKIFTFKTIDLLQFPNLVKLNMIPHASNYVIENTYYENPEHTYSEICQVNNHFARSNTSLSAHLKIQKLDDNCKLGFTNNQVSLMNKFLKCFK
jgi:hypothetical protein